MGYLSDIPPAAAAPGTFFFVLLERPKVALTGIYSSWEFLQVLS